LAYDVKMQRHCGPSDHPEQPDRLVEIWKQLDNSGLVEACRRVPARLATKDELLYVHTAQHIQNVLDFNAKRHGGKGQSELFAFPFGVDTYLCNESAHCARLAAGSLLSLIDSAMDEDTELHCGMAIIRPPGHHAGVEKMSGFCLFNNVAIAARHLQKAHGLKRIMIVDWDVHHGNGTNDIFANSKDVCFFSIHRYDSGKFFPGTGSIEDVGKGPAKGFCVNVPLHKGYSDADARHAMRHILRPLAERFNPEAIVVSAGFDAVGGDPLGGCFMTPNGFGWMTRFLYHLAKKYCDGRLFLALEGGYNCDMISRCVVECINTLVLESTGTAACEIPPMPLGSPMASPGFNPSSTPASPKQSPTSKRPGIPTDTTVNTVYKASQLHSSMQLKLPVAPKTSASINIDADDFDMH